MITYLYEITKHNLKDQTSWRIEFMAWMRCRESEWGRKLVQFGTLIAEFPNDFHFTYIFVYIYISYF